jgi:hypothetical protein
LNGRYTNHKYLKLIKPIVLVDLPAFDIFCRKCTLHYDKGSSSIEGRAGRPANTIGSEGIKSKQVISYKKK